MINVIRRRRVEIFIIEMNLDSFKNLSNLVSFDFFSKLRYEFLGDIGESKGVKIILYYLLSRFAARIFHKFGTGRDSFSDFLCLDTRKVEQKENQILRVDYKPIS